jgi:hypothetical protein
MKLGIVVWASVILLATSITNAASEPPIKITVTKLLQNRKKYNGKRVDLTAYFASSCEFCGDLFESVSVGRKDPSSSIAIGAAAPHAKLTSPPRKFDGYVRIIGRFQHKHLWRTEHTVKSPTGPERSVVTANVGFGAYGLNANRITDISEFQIISPKIPLGRW